MFFLPGLDTKPWWDHRDRKIFGNWVEDLTHGLDTIRAEYLNVCDEESDYAMKNDHEQLHTGNWDWHSFVQKGEKSESFRKRCPKTTKILESVPSLMTAVPFAYSFFSTLHGDSEIAAHTGPCNLRLRVHFPLFVPEEHSSAQSEQPLCGMSVGGVTRIWEEGVPTIFDDAFVHKTWNRASGTKRVVLLFDIWHPDVHPDERLEIAGMFSEAREKGWLK